MFMPSDLAAIRDQLQQRRLACSVIGGYTDFASTAAAEVPYLEMQIQYVESLARMAAALDCSVVRIFTAYDRDDSSRQATWKNVVRTRPGNLRPRPRTWG